MMRRSLKPAERLRILVLGYVVRGPIGGMTWHHLQYVLGLHKLGHDVYFLEDSDDYPTLYDPSRHVTGEDPAYGLAYATRVFERVGLPDRWAFFNAYRSEWTGPCADRVTELTGSADMVINVSGSNPLRTWFRSIPLRVLIDTDPAFEQVRHLTEPQRSERAAHHNAFFSFGENIERGSALIPEDGFPWEATRQPIVLDAWPVTPGPEEAPFTTVMQWDSYPAREYGALRLGLKSESFEPYWTLPSRLKVKLELAIGSSHAPRDGLRDEGWEIRDPLEVTRTPWTYQRYIQGSKGEFTVAKHGYVITRSGWFSERSAAYLASGRPVVTQDTGFGQWLKAQSGVLSFQDPDEAAAAIEEVSGNYARHCDGARVVAEEYFDSDAVLTSLIQRAMDVPEGGHSST